MGRPYFKPEQESSELDDAPQGMTWEAATVNPHKEALKRVLGQMGGMAKGLKTDHLKAKFAPKDPDPVGDIAAGQDAAVDAVKMPGTGPDDLAVLRAQAAPSEAVADDTLAGNSKALSDLDPEALKALLASLK